MTDRGTCEHCHCEFDYSLVHNGFNDSAFAYCDSCGSVAILSAWFAHIPKDANFRGHGPISVESECWLKPCVCGGTFKAKGVPRCPKCTNLLSAEAATPWIEANALGTPKGWRWQGSWSGVYCIVIGGNVVNDNWRGVAA
jgi:hypothetical protein